MSEKNTQDSPLPESFNTLSSIARDESTKRKYQGYDNDMESARCDFNQHIKSNKDDYKIPSFTKDFTRLFPRFVGAGAVGSCIAYGLITLSTPPLGYILLFILDPAVGFTVGRGIARHSVKKQLAKFDFHVFANDQY